MVDLKEKIFGKFIRKRKDKGSFDEKVQYLIDDGTLQVLFESETFFVAKACDCIYAISNYEKFKNTHHLLLVNAPVVAKLSENLSLYGRYYQQYVRSNSCTVENEEEVRSAIAYYADYGTLHPEEKEVSDKLNEYLLRLNRIDR